MQEQKELVSDNRKGTKINKIAMHGFKSFAKYTELPFSNGFNVILGPNGSGKCVIGNAKIHLANGSIIKIQELVNKKIKENHVNKIDDGFVAVGDNTETLCLDINNHTITKKRIKAYVKRTSPETLLSIKTKSGKKITTTTYHPFFTLNLDGIKSIEAEKLHIGFKILVPANDNLMESNIGHSSDNGLLLCQLNKHIFLDDIIKIKEIKSKEKWVYDLCVDEHHNFIANGIFVHNSNILDALCFVLGKSSSKSLRAEKSSNLIYNGGKSKNPSKFGEVSIFFDNSKKIFPTDDKEIKVSRVVRQSGQSIYKINNKTRTRQQILDLLSIARINPDGHNIILQGDIIRFVEMHPIERRELIEEIAGISVYEEKKRKAVLELEKVDAKLKESEIILNERKSYLKELKSDRDQAMKYKEMNDKVKENKATYLKIQINRHASEKDEHEKRLGESKKELNNINQKINSIRQEISAKRKKIEEINKEIEEKGEIEQVKLNKEVESLKVELTKNNSRVETLKNEITRINQRKKDIKESIEEIGKKINELQREKASMQNKISSREKEKELFQNKIGQFKQKHKLESLGNIEKRVEEIDKKSDEILIKLQSMKESQHQLIREKDAITHESSLIEGRQKKVIDSEKEQKNQLDELEEKRKEFKKITLDLNKRLDEDSSLAVQISNNRKKIHLMQEELAKLNARQSSIKELYNLDIGIKKILELKNKHDGIFGTVADLGKVDAKYSLALEVAAGARIKSIVVEDDKIASDLIKYLKKNKLGIATFLPLNKINPKNIDDVSDIVKSKGCHGLAIDLIHFEPKFKKVFSYVFSNTLVLDDIDVARRLGIGKGRFVTLDGDLVEVSGAMHGGYRLRKKEGLGFKEKDLAKEVEGCQMQVSGLATTINVLEKNRAENENEISSLRNRKAAIEGEIIKMEKSLQLDTTDLNALKNAKSELLKQDKFIDSKIADITNKISEVNKELTMLKTEKQKLRSEIFQLRNPTLLAELNTFEQKIKEFNEEIITMSSESKGIDTQIRDIYMIEKDKSEKILKQLDKDFADFNNEINELICVIEKKEKVLKEKEALAEKFYKKFKNLFNDRSKIDSEIQKSETSINSKIEESRKIEIKLNTQSLKLAEIKAQASVLEQEFAQFEGVKINPNKNEDELKNDIKKFEKMREDIGNVNMRALEIYEEVEKQYKELLDKKYKLGKEKDSVIGMMKEIETKKNELFIKNFDIINNNFKKFFSGLTTKGEAYLVLENLQNPFEAGLRINVKITGSKFLDIRSLSGGEKTLTALAFIFAIQEHEPASFYVLDEVDAALDKHNSEKFGKLIRNYSKNAQYLLISHNDSIISEADNLYGITMNEHGISQVVSLKI